MTSNGWDVPRGRAVMATLVSTVGSSPREPGARMFVDSAGGISGAVTIGGCVDARVLEVAGGVLESRTGRLLSLPLGEDDALALGMACAGTVEVLVEPVDGGDEGDPVAEAGLALRAAIESARTAIEVATLSGVPRRLVVTRDGEQGTLGDPLLDEAAAAEARRLLDSGRSGVREVVARGVAVRLWFARHAPPLSVIVFGATIVAVPLVAMAATMGMRTVVVDGRERLVSRERFPNASELVAGMPSDFAARLAVGKGTMVFVLAHDYKYDIPVLRAALDGDPGYVGVLGSRKRGAALLEFLAADGVSPDRLARVHVPMGLDIGSVSAEEIALSALAEALAVIRGRRGGSLRDLNA